MLVRRLALTLVLVAALVGPAGASSQTADTVSVTTFVINGRGWGHGVGMAQWARTAMPNTVSTYEQILAQEDQPNQVQEITCPPARTKPVRVSGT